MDIVLSESQNKAIDDITDWYKHRAQEQQVYRLLGYAGTGKTTLVKAAIDNLGIKLADVAFATPTAKAALVMARKSKVQCRTIHNLIYLFVPPPKDLIESCEVALLEMEASLRKTRSPTSYTRLEQQIKHQNKTLSDLKKPGFRLNPKSDLAKAKLLVLDECSMINTQTAEDLLSFGVPVLFIGDPGQLPPPRGSSPGFIGQGDTFLQEIHRQAADSPIIRLATLARQRDHIACGSYSDLVHKISFEQMEIEYCLAFDQVICGLNRTRRRLNNEIRKAAGFKGWLPNGPDEKIMVKRNGHGLVNGEFVKLSEVSDNADLQFSATITTEEGENLGGRRCYTGHYLDHLDFQEGREAKDWRARQCLIETTFGYAITAHNAQGSGFGSVLLVDEWYSGNRAKWLYTAITRAEDALVIVGTG